MLMTASEGGGGPTWVRVNRRALEQDGGGAVTQRTVHHVTVTRYPADVGHTAEHVPVPVIEHVLKPEPEPTRQVRA